jgi:hypothetical protein
MSVPLVNALVAIVVERLDIEATRLKDPPGSPSVGYSPEQRAPYPYHDPTTGDLTDTRQYQAEVRIPCQWEVQTWERLAKDFAGDAPDSNNVFVAHHAELSLLGLMDSDGAYHINKGDRITAIEKNGIPGAVVRPLDGYLYIFEVQPRGQGFGDLAHDLALIYTTRRPDTSRGS